MSQRELAAKLREVFSDTSVTVALAGHDIFIHTSASAYIGVDASLYGKFRVWRYNNRGKLLPGGLPSVSEEAVITAAVSMYARGCL